MNDRPRRFRLSALLLLALAGACSKGGEQTTSPVKLAQDSFFLSLGAAARITTFPIPVSVLSASDGLLLLADDGRYRTQNPPRSPSSPSPYFLDEDGRLRLRVPLSTFNVNATFYGAMDLNGKAALFFVDRVRKNRDIGKDRPRLFLAVPKISGSPNLKGGWHALGSTLEFAKAGTPVSADRIGRAFAGTLNFDAAGNLSNSSWTDSTGSRGTLVLVGGKAKTFSGGELELTLDLKGRAATGVQSYSGAVGKHLAVLLDGDPTDGNAGLLVLVRKQANPPDKTKLVGTWWIGTHTIFNNPNDPIPNKSIEVSAGSDAAEGTLTLDDKGGFEIRITGILGTSFGYKGTWKTAPNGGILLREADQARDWVGAVDPDHGYLVFSDAVTRSASRRTDYEIGLWFGVKKVPVKGK